MARDLKDKEKNALMVLSAFQNADAFYCNDSRLLMIDEVMGAEIPIKLKRMYLAGTSDQFNRIVITYRIENAIRQFVFNLKSLEEAQVDYSKITMIDAYGKEATLCFHRITELNIANPDSQD